MGKKDKRIEVTDPEARACPTCSEWGNIDQKEFPCALARVVVKRTAPRVGCRYWRAAR